MARSATRLLPIADLGSYLESSTGESRLLLHWDDDGAPLALWALKGAAPGPTLVATGAVHGNEYPGPRCLMRLAEDLDAADLRGTLLLLPIANVPAYEAGCRNCPVDGKNLARVFPGDPQGSFSERLAHALLEHLISLADWYIDLHAADGVSTMPTLCGYYTLPGEMGRQCREAARAFGAPVLWESPLNECRTISEAVRRGIPALYTETTGMASMWEQDTQGFYDGMRNLMQHLGILPGESPTPPTQRLVVTPPGAHDSDTNIHTTAEGLLQTDVGLLDEVAAGQRLGRVLDRFGIMIEEIRADVDGVVMMVRTFARVRPGDSLFILG